jgi:hypothetical protein
MDNPIKTIRNGKYWHNQPGRPSERKSADFHRREISVIREISILCKCLPSNIETTGRFKILRPVLESVSRFYIRYSRDSE